MACRLYFGRPASEPLVERSQAGIREIKSQERLEGTADQLLKVQSWEEKHRERWALLPSQTLGTHCPAAPAPLGEQRRGQASPDPAMQVAYREQGARG